MNVGIDIGATKTLLAGFGANGKLINERKFPTNTNGKAFLAELGSELSEFSADAPIEKMVVGMPGAVDKKNLVSLSGGGVLEWRNLELGPTLQRFCKNIYLENDAKLAGLAEAAEGAGKDCELVLYITISSGIGTAVLSGGKQLLPRSEGGQMIMNLHSTDFEDISSGKAIKARYGQYGFEIKDKRTWEHIARDMAVGLYNLITVIGPDAVVLGGGVAVHYKKFITPLLRCIENLDDTKIYPTPPILQAKFVETAVIEGCRTLLMTKHNKT